jgi:hypothetical protein
MDLNSFKNFIFQKKEEKLNWNVLMKINIDSLIKNIDIETLENITKNITFSSFSDNGIFVLKLNTF